MGIDKTKIRDELLPEVRSYADNTPLADKDTLDCSLGINPYGFPDVVIDIVHSFDVNRLYLARLRLHRAGKCRYD